VGAPAAQSEPDPKLHQGDPVQRISGFRATVPGDRPQLARSAGALLPGRCGAGGLPVLWPADQPTPEADLWLAMKG